MIKRLMERLNKNTEMVDKHLVIEEELKAVDREAAEALQFMMTMISM